MERYNLIYFEQPVEGIEHLAEVARAIDAPVMADESAWNAHDVIQIIEKRAAQIVSIYTTKPGGLYRAMEVAAVARAAGLICNVNGSVETGIGNLANLALAAAAPSVVLSCVVPVSTPAEAQSGQVGGIYYKDDLIVSPMRLVDGAVDVPEGAGMGIAVDEAKIKRYSVAKGVGAMRQDVIARQARADEGRGPRRHRLDLAGEFRLRHRLPVADPAADALAARDGGGRCRRATSRSASSTWRRAPSAPSRRPDTEIAVWQEFKFDAMAVLADLAAQAGPRRSQDRHRDGLHSGRRLRRAEGTAAEGDVRAGAGAAGAAARGQDAGRDRDPAPAVAHRRQGDHRRLSCGACRIDRDGHRRRR